MAPLIGYHTSSAGGYFNAIKHAVDYYLETFQFFLGSPRTWRYRNLKKNELSKFKTQRDKAGYDITTVHMKYLPNPSTPKEDKEMREKTEKAFLTEIERCDLLGVNYLVFHIGSHKGNGFEVAKPMVIDLLELGLKQDPQVNLLLETSAGQSNSVGSTFDEIGEIIHGTSNKAKIGVCFDTCHVYAAGYDLTSEIKIRQVLQEFDDTIGLDYLKVVHANDSKGKLGKGKDRHTNIGEGHIGKDGFRLLLEQPEFDGLPFILETPSSKVKNDIQLLKEMKTDILNSQ